MPATAEIPVTTEQLVAFDWIVREGSFSRAAVALGIAQPSISARIQALEREAGGPLFARRGRSLALTERGTAFLPFARRALAVIGEGIEAAQLSETGQRGRVTVGIMQSLADAYLAPIITRFHREHPQVELAIRPAHSDEIAAMVRDGVAQIGLVAWPTFSPEIVPVLRFAEPVVLVAAPGHPLARRSSVMLDEVAEAADPLYALRWDLATGALLDRLVRRARTAIEAPSTVVRHLLPKGRGLAFYIRALVADDLASGRLVEVPVADLAPLMREAAIVRLDRETSLPPATEAFIAMLRDELRARRLPIS